jgi:methionyl-tRNA synthetase
MPETGDTDFSWQEFARRNNDELVATYGNLVHRVLTFVYRNFDGSVPVPGQLDSRSQAIIEQAKDTLKTMDRLLYQCRFKEAIKSAMSLAQEVNRYLEEKSPWKIIKENRQAAADSLYVALYVISSLRTMLYPFLPFSSQKLHQMLGFEGNIEKYGWQPTLLEPGQKLMAPEPLFSKLDEELVAEETAKLGQMV